MWLSLLTGEQKETMLRLAHNVIVSDGLLDPNEEGMLEAFRREMGVSRNFQIEYLELAGIDAIFAERKERREGLSSLHLLVRQIVAHCGTGRAVALVWVGRSARSRHRIPARRGESRSRHAQAN